jgi:hypothetical protein
MSAIRIVAVALIVAGALGLAYGAFSFTEGTHHAALGAFDLAVRESEAFKNPVWASVDAILVGGVLALLGRKKG